MNRMHLWNCSHQLTFVWQNVDYRTRFDWSVCQRGQRRPLQHHTMWTPSKLCPMTSRKPLPWTTRCLRRRLRTGTTSKPGNPWAIRKSLSPMNTGLVRLCASGPLCLGLIRFSMCHADQLCVQGFILRWPCVIEECWNFKSWLAVHVVPVGVCRFLQGSVAGICPVWLIRC